MSTNSVSIYSLSHIKSLTPTLINDTVVRISITDWDQNEHYFIKNHSIVDSLCLEFCDVTLDLVTTNPAFKIFEDLLFTPEQAKLVISFLVKHKNIPLIVNCYAGVSRSAAIGKIACEIKGIDDSWISPPNYNPNPYVYSLLKEEWKYYEKF